MRLIVTVMSDQANRIRTKLLARGLAHGNPLSEQEVIIFERKHRIRLPDGFRDFIIHVANGCAGPPHYGLLPLGTSHTSMSEQENGFWQTLPDVSKPFPFTQQWVWETEEKTAEGTHEHLSHGTLYLGTEGCGMNWHLVVTGPERGSPWLLTGEGIGPLSPKRDFLQWMEDWLDGRPHFEGVDL